MLQIFPSHDNRNIGLVKANKITYSTLRLETPRDFVIKELKEVANELSLNIGNVVNVSLPDLEIAASIQIRTIIREH